MSEIRLWNRETQSAGDVLGHVDSDNIRLVRQRYWNVTDANGNIKKVEGAVIELHEPTEDGSLEYETANIASEVRRAFDVIESSPESEGSDLDTLNPFASEGHRS